MSTSFDNSLPMVLNRALDAVMPAYRELLARFDMTDQQWRVMRLLWSEKRITSADLSRRALLPAPSLVGIIDRLEKKGMVSRVRSLEDRRAVHIVATAKGRALEREVMPLVAKIDADLRARVTQQDWAAMCAILETIANPPEEDTARARAGG